MMIKMKRNKHKKQFWNIGLKNNLLINILKRQILKDLNDSNSSYPDIHIQSLYFINKIIVIFLDAFCIEFILRIA